MTNALISKNVDSTIGCLKTGDPWEAKQIR